MTSARFRILDPPQRFKQCKQFNQKNLPNAYIQVESPIDNSSDPANDEDDMCSTLDYLDDACPRDRIYYLLEAAQTHSKNSESKVAPDQGQGDSTQVGQGQCEGHSERWLNLLMNLSQKYELTRLQRIMRDVVPSE